MINNEYTIVEPKRVRGKILRLIVLLLLVVMVIGLIYYFTKINRGSSEQSLPVSFTIEKGESTRVIAEKLKSSNVINNPRLFLIYTILNSASGKIQAGNYTLDQKMSIVEIVDILTAGKVTSNEKKVTVIEGWTNKQIAARLSDVTEEQFQNALTQDYNFKYSDVAKPFKYEGFLFPDTYKVSKDDEASDLVRQALKNFEQKFTDQMLIDLQAKGLKFSDVIVMASIIEKEVGRNTSGALSETDLGEMQRERELVASVFYNRLEIGMPLQSDATVNYITGRSDRQARFDDLKITSPYNTYVVKGLPPSPIGNPGLDSIKAAIYPADSEYLYFLSKVSGEAVFSKTLEEHNENKQKYLE